MLKRFDTFRWKFYTQLLRIRPTILVDVIKRLLVIQRIVVQSPEGRFWIDPVSNMGTQIRANTFEVDTRTFIKSRLAPGHIFVDIGANEGFYTVIAAQEVAGQGRVLAIEPQQRLTPVIQRNIDLNRLHNVEIINTAITDGSTTGVELYLSPSTYTGSSSIVNPYFIARKQTVTAKTLTQLFDEHDINLANFVKVDVEGYEPEVLRGAERLLAEKRIQQLFIEYHGSILKQRNIDAYDLHNFITSFGYVTDAEFHVSGYNLYMPTQKT